MRLLVVEDDADLRETLVKALTSAGYGVDSVAEGAAAGVALETEVYNCIVLDLGLADIDGLSVLRRLRERRNITPVLILTARDSLDQRIIGLKSGADDYLGKPFALSELEARIEALIRRSSGGVVRLINGPLELDLEGRSALLFGKRLDFSSREMSILESLMKKLGKVVLKTSLAQQISDWNHEVGINAIEVYVHRVRKRLAPHINIRTVHGLGYLMDVYRE